MTDDGGNGAPATDDADQQPDLSTESTDSSDDRNGTENVWDTIEKEFGSPQDVRKALEHARRWEARAKQNVNAAQQVPTLQEQLAQLQQQLAERDERDSARAEKTALAQLRGALGERQVKWDDIDPILRPAGKQLLSDGEPNDELIEKLADALAKNSGRPTPDPDQGRRGDGNPTDMNALIRRAAGRA